MKLLARIMSDEFISEWATDAHAHSHNLHLLKNVRRGCTVRCAVSRLTARMTRWSQVFLLVSAMDAPPAGLDLDPKFSAHVDTALRSAQPVAPQPRAAHVALSHQFRANGLDHVLGCVGGRLGLRQLWRRSPAYSVLVLRCGCVWCWCVQACGRTWCLRGCRIPGASCGSGCRVTSVVRAWHQPAELSFPWEAAPAETAGLDRRAPCFGRSVGPADCFRTCWVGCGRATGWLLLARE